VSEETTEKTTLRSLLIDPFRYEFLTIEITDPNEALLHKLLQCCNLKSWPVWDQEDGLQSSYSFAAFLDFLLLVLLQALSFARCVKPPFPALLHGPNR
jgi:hypothetical protein